MTPTATPVSIFFFTASLKPRKIESSWAIRFSGTLSNLTFNLILTIYFTYYKSSNNVGNGNIQTVFGIHRLSNCFLESFDYFESLFLDRMRVSMPDWSFQDPDSFKRRRYDVLQHARFLDWRGGVLSGTNPLQEETSTFHNEIEQISR